ECTLQRARSDQDGKVWSRPTDDRGEREPGETDEKRALAPEIVGHPSAEQQQSAEGQGVRGHDPLPVSIRGVERRLRRGQRNADDGGVESNHELRHRDEGEGEPAPPACLGNVARLLVHRGSCAHVLSTPRRPATLTAPPIAIPATTAPRDTSRLGLTVISKTTPNAIPTLINHEAVAACLVMRPRMTPIPVPAPMTAIKNHAAIPTTTHPVQPHCAFIKYTPGNRIARAEIGPNTRFRDAVANPARSPTPSTVRSTKSRSAPTIWTKRTIE